MSPAKVDPLRALAARDDTDHERGPEVSPLPDLLHVEPETHLDAEALIPLLRFAFAGGDVGPDIRRAMAEVIPETTDWAPNCFAADLFVSELVTQSMGFQIDGKVAPLDADRLCRTLTRPPKDPAVSDHRRRVLRELHEQEDVRQQVEGLYRALCRLRACFVLVDSSARGELLGLRLDTLRELREVITRLSGGFEGCQSGLTRLREFGGAVSALAEYGHLLELLEYENNRGSVDLHLEVGADGRIRRFSILEVSDNEDNRYYESPWRRMVNKLWLWVRGFRFSDEELLDRWVERVFERVVHLVPVLFELEGHIEFYLAALAFRRRCEAQGLSVCFPEPSPDGGRSYEGLFNPLLFAQDIVPVPCDLQMAPESTTIVTGPNSGGKTRLLQALGLAQTLAQAGFWVPAARAVVPEARSLFVSLIEEARVDQQEGRLGTELLRIRRLFERVPRGALVILDELCSGTNPSEGEEIFVMVLELLRELGADVLITTHFLAFAARLSEQDDAGKLTFLQVELDDRQLPTFSFVDGVASTSLATRTAARLGVTREELRALVKKRG